MKGFNNYIPQKGERCFISAPNMDDENGYCYDLFNVLSIDEENISYGNTGCHLNTNKIEHCSIKKYEGRN